MRTISKAVLRGIALLALLMVIGSPATFAEETTGLPDPPQARIKPPGGVASESRIKPPSGDPTTDARIRPPSGEPTTDARIKIPGGSPESGFFDLVSDWLLNFARIRPPIG